MALHFEEIEPPSQPAKEKTKILQNLIKIKNQSYKQFLGFNLRERFHLIKTNILEKLNGLSKHYIQSGSFLPHFAILVVALVVLVSNIGQKRIANAAYNELISVDPDQEYAIAQTIDFYTPLIKNDSEDVQTAILARSGNGGFLSSNFASVDTLISAREEPLPDNSDKTVEYIVRNGDTLTGLGWKFEVKLATLKYVNNIDQADLIKPGAKIKIPPRGYEVPASEIAKRENARLASANRNTVTRNAARTVNVRPGSRNNSYPYGWCTYYVATRRAVPGQWGDAKHWLNSARNAGWSTGSTPAAGAIVVTSESWWGHVAYVESVNGNQITISEMNYKGWGVVSRRTISASSGIVRGFVY